MPSPDCQRLGVVFGDQLSSAVIEALELDQDRDRILMMEVTDESTRTPSHLQRTVLFLSAMRHFARELRDKGWRVEYVPLTDGDNTGAFGSELGRAIERLIPESLAVVHPGSWDVMKLIESIRDESGLPTAIAEDPRFTCGLPEFEAWAKGRKQLTMEYFYRERRRVHDILLSTQGKPVGGEWNYDKDNRERFKSKPDVPPPPRFRPDTITKQVIQDVRETLPDLPGRMESFSWPVTRKQALKALDDFIEHRLPLFGAYEDAMWLGERVLYHSALSSSLNLGLLLPMECVDAAVDAYERKRAPLNSVEGFVRQLIGWREFVRGVYWTQGPRYPTRNALRQHGDLPEAYWTGETDMACLRDSVQSVLDTAYTHHIPRLMVLGNLALTSGVHPRQVSDWFLGMFVDGVEWATDPNVIGMAMHADGGVVGTKPYAASGKYISRMSNACKSCSYDLKSRSGDGACPYNVFYWDFLIRHRETFAANNRMAMIVKNVDRMEEGERAEITMSAKRLRSEIGIGAISR